ncbi:hypothetical protein BOO69_14350 [Sulfitobacter alexandrii]|uniref:Curlin n=1 Tax=Sulfitobacter alexandrii TaxID=1917485 RepID=A0A1J0WJI8_9RHOB|nr:hypothetical protein [Sulfitobacter alexandrii]APE44461.1 hypothetical protein BOO69_14350 [Sulfitobacter alexandrii]
MKLTLAFVAALSIGVTAAQADTLSNTLTIIDTGSENRLTVVQSDGGGHTAEITLSGTDNGAAALVAGPLMPELVLGRFEQKGFGHVARLDIGGRNNGFAGLQTGSGHFLSGEIMGSDNLAQVVQTGAGQTAVFRQIGTRNNLSIRQSSW